MTSLDIIIVNWNAGPQLNNCLESIVSAKRDSFKLGSVVVVDNNSTDGSINNLPQLDLPLIIIGNRENRGFAAACNQGAADSQSNYILFLNPDTLLFTDTLSNAINFMEQPLNGRIGICGIRLVDEFGENQISCARFPTARIMIGKATGLSKYFPQSFPDHLLHPAELSHNMHVEQVIGAFFLVRKELFFKLKGFDERFFVYFEEVDFSLRARYQGYMSYYLADTRMYHKGGGCSENDKGNRLFYSLQSRITYWLKHFTKIDCVVMISFIFTIEFIGRSFYALSRRSLLELNDTLAAYKKLIKSIYRDVLMK
jgi:N-acetylglucosaminyl-diphospho-decaprenol L-rhamnosyltransferase